MIFVSASKIYAIGFWIWLHLYRCHPFDLADEALACSKDYCMYPCSIASSGVLSFLKIVSLARHFFVLEIPKCPRQFNRMVSLSKIWIFRCCWSSGSSQVLLSDIQVADKFSRDKNFLGTILYWELWISGCWFWAPQYCVYLHSQAFPKHFQYKGCLKLFLCSCLPVKGSKVLSVC